MIFEIKHNLKQLIENIVSDLYSIDVSVVIERPKNSDMGDIAIPMFMLAKQLKKSPVEIANQVASKIVDNKISDVNVVNGFINLKLDKMFYSKQVITNVLKNKSSYGSGSSRKDKTVIVEYSSPNIAKPFHIGHIRSTIIGAALFRAFDKRGYNAVGINHLGDYGTQFGKLIVAIKKWGDRLVIEKDPINELLKLYIKFHKQAKLDLNLEDQAREWFTKLENGNDEAYELWEWIREVSLIDFNRVYDMLNIKYDSLAGESFYSDKMPEILEEMRSKNVLVKDDGAEIVCLEDYGMPNALITKRDGSTMYITRDLAAAKYRHDHYNFYKNIYVVGHEQELHFKQWMKIHELLGNDWVKNCKHVSFGLISLEEGNLSTRDGRVLFLEDVLKKAIEKSVEILKQKNSSISDIDSVSKQIGIGAVVFQELFVNRKKDYEFSWEKTLSFEGETGPYIQYTGVRINSLLKTKGDFDFSKIEFSEVSSELWNIVTTLMNFEEVLETVLDKYDPSQLAKYVLTLASNFNKFYANHKINTGNEFKTSVNLCVCEAVYTVIVESLRILGIEVPNEM